METSSRIAKRHLMRNVWIYELLLVERLDRKNMGTCRNGNVGSRVYVHLLEIVAGKGISLPGDGSVISRTRADRRSESSFSSPCEISICEILKDIELDDAYTTIRSSIPFF